MRKLGGVTMLAMAMALTACGAPSPRDRCSSDAQCGAGHYCAAGGVCWPDAAPPVLDAVAVTCPTPCLRDSTVTVAVTAHDDVGVAAVTASLDLAPATVVPLALQAGAWRADLALGDWPFRAFEQAVAVTVEARDGAGNRATAVRPVGTVTRLRWSVDFAPGETLIPLPGAVAVDGQGTAVLGATNGKVHFIGPDGVATRDPVPVGAGFLTAPVVVGNDGVWVPSDDGKVYRVPTDPALPVEVACDTRAAVRGLALGSTGTPLATSASRRFYAVQACGNSSIFGGDALYQPIAHASTFYGAEGNNLHALTLDVYGIPVEVGTAMASLNAPIAAPLALRANGDILALTGATGGATTLFAISPSGAVTPLAATGAPADGPAVRVSGDILVPEAGKTLSCWTGAGALRWRSGPLAGVPLTPLVLSGADALVVADGRGGLTALDELGQPRWSVQLAPSGTALHPINLHAPPGAARSTGYVPAANGKLHAVILDGRLDAAAPWPKAFHDPGNTGNSATPPPP